MALESVHAAHLVHCDVKPENILVGSVEGKPTMKLCDFGQSGPPGVPRPIGIHGVWQHVKACGCIWHMVLRTCMKIDIQHI